MKHTGRSFFVFPPFFGLENLHEVEEKKQKAEAKLAKKLFARRKILFELKYERNSSWDRSLAAE